jgi:hypothetical protein
VAVRQRLTSELRKPIAAPRGTLTHFAAPRLLPREAEGRAVNAQPASPCATAPEPMAGALWTGYDPRSQRYGWRR